MLFFRTKRILKAKKRPKGSNNLSKVNTYGSKAFERNDG